MNNQIKHKIFVYGSLMRGCSLHELLANSEFHGPGILEGQISDLGRFPAAKIGMGEIIGEVYSVSSQILHQLDRVEGFDPKGPISENFYLRTKGDVRMFSGNSESVDFYLFANEVPDTLIPHGDFRRHLLESLGSDQWVLSYGSNLSSAKIQNRVGPILSLKIGHIPDFQLVFNKGSLSTGETFANIEYRPRALTPAVCYLLNEEQLEILDFCEGVPTHYHRLTLPFLEHGKSVIHFVQGYIAHPNQRTSGSPVKSYLQHLQIGYLEHGFDPLEINQINTN